MADDERVREHHQLNGHESKQTLRDGGGHRNLEGCSPWGCQESTKGHNLASEH